ncbi:hypothetical protein Trydic_g8766 [Trypoxylus dichotomus]
MPHFLSIILSQEPIYQNDTNRKHRKTEPMHVTPIRHFTYVPQRATRSPEKRASSFKGRTRSRHLKCKFQSSASTAPQSYEVNLVFCGPPNSISTDDNGNRTN